MIEEVCRPVLFEQNDSDCPYWGKGSSFLIASTNNYYWVTAAHVISNMGGCSDSLRIFPSDGSKHSLPFNQQYRINADTDQNEDYTDLYVLRVDIEKIVESGNLPLSAQDIEYGTISAYELQVGARLLVIGYPSESTSISYDDFKIKHKRLWMPAEYIGPSIEDHCHELRVSDTVQINNYDGLSGSPVFYLKKVAHEDKTVILPLLAGLLLRGGSMNRVGHFLSADILVELIKKAESAIV